MAQIKTPIIARATYDNLVEAIADEGKFAKLDRTMFVLLTDDEHKDMFAFVTPERSLHLIIGNNEEQAEAINELKERLNAVDAQFEVVVTDIDSLKAADVSLSDRIDQVIEQVNTVEGETSLLRSDVNYLNDILNDVVEVQSSLTTNVSDLKNKDQELEEAISHTYTKDEVDQAIFDFSNTVYTKEQTDNKITELAENVYTKDETNAAIESAVGDIGEGVTVTEYVTNTAENTLSQAKEYADTAIQLSII